MELLVTPVDRAEIAVDEIRVLVVDGNDVLRLGVRTLLGKESDIVVVGEAATRDEGLTHVVHRRPDVVIFNMSTPGAECAIPDELVRFSRVVVVTDIADFAIITQAMAAGALSYLVYGQFQPSLLPTVIRHAAIGQPCLTSTAISAVVEWFRRGISSTHDGLTAREREVMDLLAKGLSNQDIATNLDVSVKTVKNHLHRAFKQLDVTDRRAAGMLWRSRT